jgi:hypothetical protein
MYCLYRTGALRNLVDVLMGTRKKRKTTSSLRWLDNVQQDLQTLGVRNWEELVSDRIRWRGIVKAVLA